MLGMMGMLAAMSEARGVETLGYYRQPSLAGDVLVFVAEGDVWKVSLAAGRSKDGGVATRLTSHVAEEASPKLSADGSRIAFTGQYEGPTEVYVMPTAGGLPTRLTFDGARAGVAGWAGQRVLASTNRFSTLPSTQLTLIDPTSGKRDVLPLAQASDGYLDEAGGVLYFTRLAFQGSHTKRYKGGTAQQLWKFDMRGGEGAEATGLTTDFAGTSYAPVMSGGRIYYLSDRDGTMDIWSMLPDASERKQISNHAQPGTEYLDVRGFTVDGGRAVYQLGADLWTVGLDGGEGERLKITIDSDFDQTRERWVLKPMDYLTASHISPDGDRVALTARGTVFVVPRLQGRLVELPSTETVAGQGVQRTRQRDGRFMPDGKSVLTISDKTGETEFWSLPANGVDVATKARQLTTGASVLRWAGVPSPDGAWLAHIDKDQRLFVTNVGTGVERLIEQNQWDLHADLIWSADSAWLAFTTNAANMNLRVRLLEVATGTVSEVTTDRYSSYSPGWSIDGKWLYFLSDRQLRSTVASPWGLMAPEPHFDKSTKVYAVSLVAGERWPFAPDDELHALSKAEKEERAKEEKIKQEKDKQEKEKQEKPKEEKPKEEKPTEEKAKQEKVVDETSAGKEPGKGDGAGKDKERTPPLPVVIERDGLAGRLYEVPVAAGNYSSLTVQEKRLLMLSQPPGESKAQLITIPIANREIEVKTIVPEVESYQVSLDGKWMLIRRPGALFVIESGAGPAAPLDKAGLNLAGWTFPVWPRQEWRQMFIEAWRLSRDYFWDSNMHGVDWKAMLERYLPLTDRVATRGELNDLIAQMVGELSALHIFVRGGDSRRGETDIAPASLGGLLARDEAAGGYRVETVFTSDPDEPERRSPLAAPAVNVRVGDVVLAVNGRPALSVTDLSMLLRNQAGKQVLLRVATGGVQRDVIVTPMTAEAEEDLRYHQWQYTRRLAVDAASKEDIGYVHLRAMGTENFSEFAKGFYPVFQRRGLILDARNNRGGNIDSWVLSRLLRRAWFYWSPDVGSTYWNMQFAFRGHIVVLCNERTASDGEALAEGIRRLKLGTIIGTRTWGGKIWLSANNFLVDKGIATAAEIGVFGPEGEWLIEGHGVDPDIVVDNLPHATFLGKDTQLEAAIAYLQKKIKDEPVEVPPTPKRPDKSWKPK